jgi:hypothetical protein
MFQRKEGRTSKANVAKEEASNSDDDNFTLAVQVARKSLMKNLWLLDSTARASAILSELGFAFWR